jgi:hypothetical protein
MRYFWGADRWSHVSGISVYNLHVLIFPAMSPELTTVFIPTFDSCFNTTVTTTGSTTWVSGTVLILQLIFNISVHNTQAANIIRSSWPSKLKKEEKKNRNTLNTGANSSVLSMFARRFMDKFMQFYIPVHISKQFFKKGMAYVTLQNQ